LVSLNALATELVTAAAAVLIALLGIGVVVGGQRNVIFGRDLTASFAACEPEFARIAGRELASGTIPVLKILSGCEIGERSLVDSPFVSTVLPAL